MWWSLFSGFLGGIAAWVVTTALGQPLQRFLQLRQQAANVMAQDDDHAWIGNPEAKPPDDDWLRRRREAYDKVGHELVAFADSNTFVVRLLNQRVLGRYRCYVRSAGGNLRALAAAYPGTKSWDELRRRARSALKIVGWPRDVR
jgi:hypothetical protein